MGDNMYERLIRLIGENNLEKIKRQKILLIGLGGVGGFALEALVRCGFNNITIVDNDEFDITNLNRQIICTSKSIGNKKVDEGILRAKSINPDININGLITTINKENIDNFKDYDYIIDACDDINAKIAIIKHAQENDIKLISAMGTGKRLDPSKVTISRLDKTSNDPLAKVMRKKVKEANLSLKVPVVYSTELPINHEPIIASCILVPSIAGINMVYYIINDIIKNN